MGILVLLIGCTCLGKSNVMPFREGMTEGEYTKEKARETINKANMQNHGGSVGSYNDEDYITHDAKTASHRPFTETRKESVGMDNAMASQKEYERQSLSLFRLGRP